MTIRRYIWFGLPMGFGLLMFLIVATYDHRPTVGVRIVAQQPKAGAVRLEVLSDTPEARIDLPPEQNDQENTFITATYETARTRPVEALTQAMENAPATRAGDDLIEHAAVQWAASDPRAASAWAQSITDEELRARVLCDIATVWGDSDPVAAAELAVKILPSGRQQDDAIVGIVQRWVQTQPEAAASWVMEFPEGSLRETALENVVKIWAERDPTQTTHWLNTLTPGETRDKAVAAYVTEIAPGFPALATQWAESIEDASLRDQQLAALAANSTRLLN